MADAQLVQRAKALLDKLSESPRFAGSDEEARARGLCRKELELAGFTCKEVPFGYSEWPGRWGPPISAAVQVATIILVARIAMSGSAWPALLTGAALIVGLFFADADVKRRWILRFPLERAKSVNLEARRGSPRIWLVAHLDSKSQTVPMLFRIASSVALAALMVLTLAIVLLSLAGASRVVGILPALQIVAVVVALPSIFCFVRNGSSGAVDNASGVVSVLLAAQSAESPRDIGVLITSAEELGLAGARVWAPSAPPEAEAINCDTVDDSGDWRCMYSGQRPTRIDAAAKTLSGGTGSPLILRRLIPGILADSMALSDWGIESVTLSRGTLATLARIHTRRDTSNELTGTGAADASVLLSALAKELV
ncbi:MAG: M28 family peptidase [Gemmatimonadales bacterium]